LKYTSEKSLSILDFFSLFKHGGRFNGNSVKINLLKLLIKKRVKKKKEETKKERQKTKSREKSLITKIKGK